VTIVDDRDRPLPDGRVGEIRVEAPWVMDGYCNDPESTAAALSAGQLRTGDVGFLQGGQLFVTGRTKDMLKIRGRNVYAADIEEIAEEVRGVRLAGAVAFAVEGPNGDEAVLVCELAIARDRQKDVAAAVRARVLERLEVRLKEIVMVGRAGIPKTPSGKKQRALCRALYLSGELEPAPPSRPRQASSPEHDEPAPASAVVAAPGSGPAAPAPPAGATEGT
jgi:acyl-CoA synthetase (AMP-forming)/AMP-acid ligase II